MSPSHRRNRPHNEDWQGRLLNRTLAAAGVGMLGGSLVALYRGRPVSSFTLNVGLNAAIATACCCGATEVVRELRHGLDGWQNALLGSAIGGAVLGRIWGGPKKVLPFTCSFAVLGLGASLASDQLHEYKIRRALVAMEAEASDPREHKSGLDEHESLVSTGVDERASEQEARSLWDWLPVKRASEDDIRRHEQTLKDSQRLREQRGKSSQ